MKKSFYILNFALPVFCGGILYYLFCPDTLFVMKLDSFLGVAVHFPLKTEENIILSLLRCYLFDVLWAYSLVFILYFSQDNDTHKVIRSFMFAWILGILMEFAQLRGLCAGTFDMADIAVEFWAGMAAVFMIKKSNSYEGRETNERI